MSAFAWDHPRSRGVYPVLCLVVAACSGSSPLARGLPKLFPGAIAFLWIIPARAGFTDSARKCAKSCQDHPRSRGVYYGKWPASHETGGSSPLARGLRAPMSFVDRLARIIPARAGFTYGKWPASHETGGSSPLARGLRDNPLAHPRVIRIIPARAGFTACGPAGWRRTSDHPRSRGVYTCGSLESQRTRTLPDPGCLHCRPRARSAELR